ncbi:hypothetical protein QQF64_021519 [Cirrhinus molitorella]|uniref:Uncharacterized protein n=2 Tax=Cirrhinus molitorella TaxID=172907 RepID=A0AA88TKK4_9TELE|nr:hypothetical protein Q8A67_024892 [Cirrhinus molitorella]
MWPFCCPHLTCADGWEETGTLPSEEKEDQSSVRMDIELLKEQYNSIREKQRRQTHVICFRKAQNDEEMSGRNLVDLVPVCQIQRSPSTKTPETPLEFVVDSESCLWRSHLDMHRTKHTPDETEHRNENSEWSTEASSTSSESERLSDDSNPGEPHLKSSRKFSAPAVLSRQLSFGSYRSTPSGSKYYPFPQRKSLRKSETARKLGLYASL